MPIYLPPVSRRRFLAGSLAAAGAFALGGSAWADEGRDVDENRFALLSDIHIHADPAFEHSGVNMFNNLRQVSGELNALKRRPVCAMINGDLAFGKGEAADYETIVKSLRPLREGGYPLNLTLGNHDHRDRFRAALPQKRERLGVEDRQAMIVESPRLDWFILDSLDKTNVTPGLLGAKQRNWLEKSLDSNNRKPAIVMVHHNPDDQPDRGGLNDTKELLAIMLPRKRVKALVFGHTHNWEIRTDEGFHYINLPPVAYVFEKGKPNGWVDVNVSETSASFEMRCLDPMHPQHAQKRDLKWRS